MIIFQLLMLLIITIVVPNLLGLLFCREKDFVGRYPYVYHFLLGFILSLCLMHLIAFPLSMLNGSFMIVFWIYSVVFFILIILGIIKSKKLGRIHFLKDLHGIAVSIDVYAWIYLIAFILILAYQCYKVATGFFAGAYYDDAGYVAYSATMVSDNTLFGYDAVFGGATNTTKGVLQRTFQSQLVYMAYISKFTGINSAALAHTYCAIEYLVMSYMACYLLSTKLFKRIQDQVLFMYLVVLLNHFGYFSGVNFLKRLFGNIWTGKGIVACILNVLLMYIIWEAYDEEKYSKWYAWALAIFSVAALGCTLGGTVTMVAIPCVLTIIFQFREINLKKLLYVVWAVVPAGLYSMLYLLLR